MSSSLTRLPDYEAAIACDPIGYLSLAVPADECVGAWDLFGAVAVAFTADFGISLLTLGAADAVRVAWPELVIAATDATGETIARATVPSGSADAVAFTATSSWNWMTTSVAPAPQPNEDLVTVVADDDIVNNFLDEANPDASTRPGHSEIIEWAGIVDPHDSNRLLAAAAQTQWRSGARTLVSVATRPDARGHGYAGAVSAFLTRRILASRRPLVSLGYYADNIAAERVYERLGFEIRSRNTSGWLIDRPDHLH